jgi:hypothetical protein
MEKGVFSDQKKAEKRSCNSGVLLVKIGFNKILKRVKTVKGKMQESSSVLKALFGKVPIISSIQIVDQSEYSFTMILTDQDNKSVTM